MSKVLQVKSSEDFNLEELKRGQIHRLNIHIQKNALGIPWKIPLLVARGHVSGPTVGICAAIHGNELNGIPTIFKLFDLINPKELKGTLVAAPVVNIPGFLAGQREFSDKKDLNRVMPGKEKGTSSDMYAFHFAHKIIKKFDYLLDLHTAGAGKINSLYVRADLSNEMCKKMALLQNPQIILNKYDEKGTLRAWANGQQIPTITIEIGNPSRFQHDLIDSTLEGILNLMKHLKMMKGKVPHESDLAQIVTCRKSYWVSTYTGGIIDVLPQLTERVQKNQIIARVYDVFGRIQDEIIAPENGIVIGKNTNPVCESGTRILHLGIYSRAKEKIPSTSLSKNSR